MRIQLAVAVSIGALAGPVQAQPGSNHQPRDERTVWERTVEGFAKGAERIANEPGQKGYEVGMMINQLVDPSGVFNGPPSVRIDAAATQRLYREIERQTGAPVVPPSPWSATPTNGFGTPATPATRYGAGFYFDAGRVPVTGGTYAPAPNSGSRQPNGSCGGGAPSSTRTSSGGTARAAC